MASLGVIPFIPCREPARNAKQTEHTDDFSHSSWVALFDPVSSLQKKKKKRHQQLITWGVSPARGLGFKGATGGSQRSWRVHRNKINPYANPSPCFQNLATGAEPSILGSGLVLTKLTQKGLTYAPKWLVGINHKPPPNSDVPRVGHFPFGVPKNQFSKRYPQKTHTHTI